MKKIILALIGSMILVTFILSYIIEAYSTQAMIQSCFVLLAGGMIVLLVQTIKLSEAYRYSLTTLFSIVTIGEWAASFFAPDKVVNSWFIILAIAIFIIEVILLVASKLISNKYSK